VRIRARLASGNAHKLAELRRLLPGWELAALPLDYPPEDGDTYEANALLKARFARSRAPRDEWVLADDSGVEADALGGRPGIHSARWSGAWVETMLAELDGRDDRGGRYVCVLVAVSPAGEELVARGELGGSFATEPRGDEGFGYDPIFVPAGEERTVAELGNAWKDEHSHRALAARSLAAALRSNPAVSTNRSAPPATVTPVLIYPDVRAAVAWLESAFGFGERVRIGDDHRAQLRVGSDGAVVVADVRGAQVAPTAGAVTHLVKVRVADVDEAFARARDAGAVVLEEPRTWEYGERSCLVEDLAGHRWELTQTVRDVEPEEWGGTTVAPW